MYLTYSLLLTLGLIVLIPRFLFHAIAHGKYLPGIRQRLGAIPKLEPQNEPTIWLHCVSVGETQAARPLVRELQRNFPNYRLVVSTVTATGQALARDVFKQEAAHVIYFPFDWDWCVRRSLDKVKPDVVLMMETELWPNFLRRCAKNGIPVGLVNGRISKQSFRGYRLIRFFVTRVLQNLTTAVMQSQSDAERIRALGISPEKVSVGGNLKFDVSPATKAGTLTQEVVERFKLDRDEPFILAASTHAPEEKILLDSFHMLKQRGATPLRLGIAPRHPERFAEVASLLDKSGLTWARRSQTAQTNDRSVAVILFDTIGELPGIYPFATIVFVGGSMVRKGGHNVLEPAAVGTAIITGAHNDNFEAIVRLLHDNGAIITLPPLKGPNLTAALCDAFHSLLVSPTKRHELSRNALQIVEANRGAALKTLTFVTPLFQPLSNPHVVDKGLTRETANS
jgi:3-deoxy-D-manno-octulosonic-acid transferase